MKIAHTLNELAGVHDLAANYLFLSMHTAADPLNASFMEFLGGDVHVIETQEDANAALEQYDMDVVHHCDGYVMCFSINNNSGGPTFVFPTDLYREQTPTEVDVDETNYDPYAGCDVWEYSNDDVPF